MSRSIEAVHAQPNEWPRATKTKRKYMLHVEDRSFAAYVDPADDGAITNPALVVEVLCDITEARDRGEKFAHDRRIPSLREYIMVSQHEPRIEVYRRTEHGRWELEEACAGESIELASVNCRLAVDDIYRDPLASAVAST
ncbi:Uma2 family endonuclease [Pendulispora albinea]|uniref:Uma2 family endonuclease n=1 Tax=Pendulispora albinea TaxID=2741071 RepID=A0ABZ2LQ96_9BACT